MTYTINEIKDILLTPINRVYDVFRDYFGEAFTDLQGIPTEADILLSLQGMDVHCDDGRYELEESHINTIKWNTVNFYPFILIWWPSVKVTNEYDKSIIIQDLYAKIQLDKDGLIPTQSRGFMLNRATYTKEQWLSNYMHSHISHIPKDDTTQFQLPCLGRGPIIETINSLRHDICENFDETKWMLFCEELSRYVHVESIAGVPYKRLENVGLFRSLPDYGDYSIVRNGKFIMSSMKELLDSIDINGFLSYYLQNGHLSIGYKQGSFVVGMPYYEFLVDISNTFIEYINTTQTSRATVHRIFDRGLLKKAVIVNGKFYCIQTSRNNFDSRDYIGKPVCTFKGQPITLNILEDQNSQIQESTVLNHDVSMFILNNILKIINYRYVNEYRKQLSSSTEPAVTDKRVFYI